MPKPPISDEVRDFLAQPNPAVVASIRPDGSPHCVPTWYEWVDEQLLLNMDRSRKRLRYLRESRLVAVTVMASEDWYSHVSFTGEVIEVRDDPELTEIDRLSQRYRGRPYWNRERDSVTAMIRPNEWLTWGDRFSA